MMEKLTDDLVKEATVIIDEIEAMGGMVSTPNWNCSMASPGATNNR